MPNIRKYFSRRSRASLSTNQPEYGIKKLAGPNDAEHCNFDIVLIHGLMGNREKTWTKQGTRAEIEVFWPAELLPSEVPTARILTYGYDAAAINLLGQTSKNNTASHAKKFLTALATYRERDGTNNRPIGFICHSLGGLVCEDYSGQPSLEKIEECTRGILFIGTPHHGADLAKYADLLTRSFGLVLQTNRSSLKVLKRESEVLGRIQDNFHTMVNDRARSSGQLPPIAITCFYEELETRGLGLIVPQSSATIPGHVSIPIRSNHKDMARFVDENDEGFKAVVGEIRRWLQLRLETTYGDGPQMQEPEVPPRPSHPTRFPGAQPVSQINFNGSVTGGAIGVNSGPIYGGIHSLSK